MYKDNARCLEFDMNSSVSMENVVRVSTQYVDECLNKFRHEIMIDHKTKQNINYDLMYDVVGSFSHQQKEYIMRYLEYCKCNPKGLNQPIYQSPKNNIISKPLIKEFAKTETLDLNDESTPSTPTRSSKNPCSIPYSDVQYICKTLSISLQNSSSHMVRQLYLLLNQMFDPSNGFQSRKTPVVQENIFVQMIQNAVNLISKSIYRYGNDSIRILYTKGTNPHREELYRPSIRVDVNGYKKDALVFFRETMFTRFHIQESSDMVIKRVRDSVQKCTIYREFQYFNNIIQFVLCALCTIKYCIPVFREENNLEEEKTGTDRKTDTYVNKYTEAYSSKYAFYNSLKYTHNYLIFLILVCLEMELQMTTDIIKTFVSLRNEDQIANTKKVYKNTLFHILEIENDLDDSLSFLF